MKRHEARAAKGRGERGARHARVDPRDITLIADAVAERMFTETARSDCLLDAAGVARLVRMTREWVYLHAVELGGVKFGSGRNARWRFEPTKTADAFAALRDTGRSESSDPTPRRRQRQPLRTASGATLLPIRAPAEQANKLP